MKNLTVMKASTWFGDKRENGLVLVTKKTILEFQFHMPKKPYFTFDFKGEYFVALNLCIFTAGLTKRIIKS